MTRARIASADTAAIAHAFTDARRAGRALPSYPGAVPATLAEAYGIQDAAIALWPDPVAGWKVARIGPPHAARVGADRLAGPIFARAVWPAGTEPVRVGVIENGYAAVEGEYVLKLGQTPPLRDDWTAASVAALVSDVFIGVEIAGSPFAGINDFGPTVTVSDFGNNAGLVLGSPVTDWSTRLDDLSGEMWLDGIRVGSGGARAIPDGPLGALAFLLNHLTGRGRQAEAGQLISTGATTGVHPVTAGQQALASFGSDGQIACLAVPAEPIRP